MKSHSHPRPERGIRQHSHGRPRPEHCAAGEVRNVPALQAPGFIHCTSSPKLLGHTFPDASSCTGVAVTLRSTTDFDG